MLRFMRHPSTLNRRAVGVMIGGVLFASLVACSASGESGPAIEPVEPSVGRPLETPPPTEERNGLLLHRRLSDLLGGVAGGRMGGDIGRADGYIRDGASLSPFEADQPAIANLDLALLAAVQRAAEDARYDGIEVRITSGWRSVAYQQSLLDEAVSRYGSREEARRYVNTPEQSKHVTGTAVDIGPTDASYWMSQYGAEYGLCQTYANEIWHYELTIEPGGICPTPLPDASAG